MSNEFNAMLSEDLAEVSGPILEMLVKNGNCNLRGIAALLQLVSCMLSDKAGRNPSSEDHAVAESALTGVASNPMATISFMAQLARAMIMVYHGYGRKEDGSL